MSACMLVRDNALSCSNVLPVASTHSSGSAVKRDPPTLKLTSWQERGQHLLIATTPHLAS